MEFIDLKTQYGKLEANINSRIKKVLNHGQFIMGPEVREMEERLEDYVGSKHCISVASGTEALLISLMAIGIKPGDEIITTTFSFIATTEVIALLGAKPIFVDINKDTCNMNASLIEEKITKNTKAIMPVSMFGQPPDMDEINYIASKHNLIVIEDAAQSFGATYKGKKSCNLTDIGCTSFFPSKPLGCYGDGGAIFTNDDQLANLFKQIRIHGQSERYIHERIGVGGRMDTIQCAIILAKMDVFDDEVHLRLAAGDRYNRGFSSKIKTIKQEPDRSSVYAQYTIMSDQRDELQKKLKTLGIPTTVHYPVPIPLQKPYKNFCNSLENYPESIIASATVLSLPMGPYIDEVSIDKVIESVLSAI